MTSLHKFFLRSIFEAIDEATLKDQYSAFHQYSVLCLIAVRHMSKILATPRLVPLTVIDLTGNYVAGSRATYRRMSVEGDIHLLGFVELLDKYILVYTVE